MKHLTLVTLFALFTNAAWADAQNNGLPADYYHGAAACDADVAIAPSTPPLQILAASQTKIALDSYYHGAAACDADVAIAPATPAQQIVVASQTKIALDSQPVAVNCTITPHAGVCSEQD